MKKFFLEFEDVMDCFGVDVIDFMDWVCVKFVICGCFMICSCVGIEDVMDIDGGRGRIFKDRVCFISRMLIKDRCEDGV